MLLKGCRIFRFDVSNPLRRKGQRPTHFTRRPKSHHGVRAGRIFRVPVKTKWIFMSCNKKTTYSLSNGFKKIKTWLCLISSVFAHKLFVHHLLSIATGNAFVSFPKLSSKSFNFHRKNKAASFSNNVHLTHPLLVEVRMPSVTVSRFWIHRFRIAVTKATQSHRFSQPSNLSALIARLATVG